MLQAQKIGFQGVPFFVFDAKNAISGAQHEETFLKTLQKVWDEGSFDAKVTVLNTNESNSCGVEGCNEYSLQHNLRKYLIFII